MQTGGLLTQRQMRGRARKLKQGEQYVSSDQERMQHIIQRINGMIRKCNRAMVI
ncbi:hypothetical protein SEN012174_01740 [Salmonella enterica subsp. enterica serovar Newport]|nr:hypothetical protein SEN012174_01740 [Salmonella enterica subsp. enterica serovar Newport]